MRVSFDIGWIILDNDQQTFDTGSKRFKKREQGTAIRLRHIDDTVPGCLCLTAVPEYGLHQVTGTAVVQKAGLAVYSGRQANAP
jgi:hypothetical protein